MKIVMTHGYSDSNKGDLAIVVGTINAIRKVCPHATISLQSLFSEKDPNFLFHSRKIAEFDVKVLEGVLPSPYVDSAQHNILRNVVALLRLLTAIALLELRSVFPGIFKKFQSNQLAALNNLLEADLVIAKGGQYIYNDQGGIRGFLYLWRVLKIVSVPVSLGKKTILLGHSFGPLTGCVASNLVRATLKKCHSVVVREKYSFDLLGKLSIATNVAIAPDMAFLVEPIEPLENKHILPCKRFIGVTVVNWSFPGAADVGLQKRNYFTALVDSLEQISKKFNLEPVLFPQVTVRHHGESDSDLLVDLHKELGARGIISTLVTDDLSPGELSYLYGQCQLLLGTRLHSCILASCSSCPVVAIRYQGYKTEGVMDALGLSSYVHDINTVTSAELFQSMLSVMESRELLSHQIKAKVQSFRNEIYGLVAACLSDSGSDGKDPN